MADERWERVRGMLEDASHSEDCSRDCACAALNDLDALRREYEAALVTLAALRQWATTGPLSEERLREIEGRWSDERLRAIAGRLSGEEE